LKSNLLSRPKVSIHHGDSPSVMAKEALSEAVRPDTIKGKKVLVKPNIGFKSEPASGIVTHPEIVSGVLEWAKKAGAADIVVGDSCIYGVNPADAFVSSGILEVTEKHNVRMLQLDQARPVKLTVDDPYIVESIKVSSIAKEVDIIISVPVIKAHMHTGATFSLKNMKGVLYRREKMRMHHLKDKKKFKKWAKWKTLDRAIADLNEVMLPQIVVIDGIVIMEGMGPLIGNSRPLGVVVASEDALAADIVCREMIGFSKEDVPHIELVAIKQGRSNLSVEDIDLDYALLSKLKTPIKHAIPQDVSAEYPYFIITNKDACSACDSTAMAFLKTFGSDYEGKNKVQIAFGNGVTKKDIKLSRCIMLGNCTVSLKDKGAFLPGCPPIPSDIKRALEK